MLLRLIVPQKCLFLLFPVLSMLAASPTKPTDLQVQLLSSSIESSTRIDRVDLSWQQKWTRSDLQNINKIGTKIYRSLNNGKYVLIAKIKGTENNYSYVDAQLPINSTIKYRIRAFKKKRHSKYSKTVTTTTGPTFYVDNSATTNGSGTQESPWNTLASVNNCVFNQGHTIFIKRGTGSAYTVNAVNRGRATRFTTESIWGTLSPRGSGTLKAPITIDAYGTGNNPIIDAQGRDYSAAILLVNQEYWTIKNMEVRNNASTRSFRYGILVSGTNGRVIHRSKCQMLCMMTYPV